MRAPRAFLCFGRGNMGVTLVELVVALAVIGVLAMLVLGAVRAMVVRGQQAQCQSNLRQLGAALALYAGDHDGWLPETRHTAPAGQSWVFLLEEYLSNVDAVRICPADPKGGQRLKNGGTSYVLNSTVFVPRFGPFGEPLGESYNRLSKLTRPAHTILAFIVSDSRGVGAANDHTHSENWTSWAAFLSDVEPDRFRPGARRADRSGGSANYLHADGHVAVYPAADVRRLFESGVNFSRPGEAP